ETHQVLAVSLGDADRYRGQGACGRRPRPSTGRRRFGQVADLVEVSPVDRRVAARGAPASVRPPPGGVRVLFRRGNSCPDEAAAGPALPVPRRVPRPVLLPVLLLVPRPVPAGVVLA